MQLLCYCCYYYVNLFFCLFLPGYLTPLFLSLVLGVGDLQLAARPVWPPGTLLSNISRLGWFGPLPDFPIQRVPVLGWSYRPPQLRPLSPARGAMSLLLSLIRWILLSGSNSLIATLWYFSFLYISFNWMRSSVSSVDQTGTRLLGLFLLLLAPACILFLFLVGSGRCFHILCMQSPSHPPLLLPPRLYSGRSGSATHGAS